MTKFSGNGIFILSAVSANLLFVAQGSIIAWNSPVLPKFKSDNPEINPLGTPITVFQMSICTSLPSAGAIIGTLLVSKLPDIFGRRKLLIYLAAIAMLSFCIMAFVNTFWMYCVMFFIVSMALAAGTAVVPMYLLEISETRNRGISSSTVAIALTFGQFYGYLLGPITSFSVFSICCAAPLLLHLALSIFTEESPIYFYLKGDMKGWMKTLQNLNLKNELTEREKMIETKKKDKSSIKILFQTHAGRKALFLALVLRCVHLLSGIIIVSSFLGPLLNEAGSKISGHSLAVIVAMVKILTTIACLFVIEKIGRRILVLVGSFSCGIAMIGIGIYFYYKENHIKFPTNFELLPAVSLFVFVIFYSLTLGGVPYLVISELLPNEVRASGTSIVFFLCNIFLVVQTFTYPLIAHYMGTYCGMFSFSIICFVSFVLLLMYLPETKGKSFSEIQNILGGRKSY